MGNTERGTVARYEYMLVRYYNSLGCVEVECLEEIPEKALFMLAHLEYKDIIKPMVIQDLHNGMSFTACARRYGITKKTVRYIRERFDLDLR